MLKFKLQANKAIKNINNNNLKKSHSFNNISGEYGNTKKFNHDVFTLDLVRELKNKNNDNYYAKKIDLFIKKHDFENSLTDNAKFTFIKRYALKDENKNAIENIKDVLVRVARFMAKDLETGEVNQKLFYFFIKTLAKLDFLPNSPTFTGADTKLGQLAACFVLPIEDDLGKEEDGIFNTLRNATLIQQSGGGNGFSFSDLRPSGSTVRSSNGVSSGPISFMQVFDMAFGKVAQGGVRRGANMAVLNVDHPDIEKFITCKAEEGKISNFNISVGLKDKFMEALEKRQKEIEEDEKNGKERPLCERTMFPLINPDTKQIVEYVDPVKLFEKIATYAHRNGEPGCLFPDTANKANPVPELYELKSTNPCGEQWLGPYENCCLGSINLSNHYDEEMKIIDWDKLAKTTIVSTIFLDKVVSNNRYVPSVPKLKKNAFDTRRIGLGIMGLADLLYKLKIGYGTKEGCEITYLVLSFIRYYSMFTSVHLAKEYGSFIEFKDSIYDVNGKNYKRDVFFPKDFTLSEINNEDYNMPELFWDDLEKEINQHGIRNACQMTIAPTGTISTVAGLEGYGCEPVFALGYIRHFNDNGDDVELKYISSSFEKHLSENYDKDFIPIIKQQVVENGSCQSVELVSEETKKIFRVSADVTPDEHMNMQHSAQLVIDNSISKTLNLPEETTVQDIMKIYQRAHSLGLKGCTVYVTGSRQKVVLETNKEKKRKEEEEENNNNNIDNENEINDGINDEKEIFFLETPPKKKLPNIVDSLSFNYEIGGHKYHCHIDYEEILERPIGIFVDVVLGSSSDQSVILKTISVLISKYLRAENNASRLDKFKEERDILWAMKGSLHLWMSTGKGNKPATITSVSNIIAFFMDRYLDEIYNKEDLSDTMIVPDDYEDLIESTDSESESEYDEQENNIYQNKNVGKIIDNNMEKNQRKIINRVISRKIKSVRKHSNLSNSLEACPQCLNFSLVPDGNCKVCRNCLYSACG